VGIKIIKFCHFWPSDMLISKICHRNLIKTKTGNLIKLKGLIYSMAIKNQSVKSKLPLSVWGAGNVSFLPPFLPTLSFYTKITPCLKKKRTSQIQYR
jgi:hypothetical protein